MERQCNAAFFTVFFLLVHFVGAGIPPENKPNCDMNIFDGCAASLMSYKEDDGSAAITLEDYRKHCRRNQEALKCLDSFTEHCLPVEAQQITGVITIILSRIISEKCADNRINEYVEKHSGCVTDNIEQLQESVNRFVRQLDALLKDNDKNKLEKLCCVFEEAKRRNENELSQKCHKDTLAFMKSTFSFGAKEVSPMVCPLNFQPSRNECNKLNIPPPTRKEVQTKWKSILPAILAILSGTDNA